MVDIISPKYFPDYSFEGKYSISENTLIGVL